MRWLDANLEEKQEPRVASAPEAQKGDSVSSSRRLDTGRDREAHQGGLTLAAIEKD
jgi:hypothetical protein